MAKRGTTKFLSNKQEKQISKDIKGKTTIASGALWSQKADVRSYKYLVECKITEKTYYPLTIKTWEKICDEALKDGMRIPLMNIQLRNGKNSIAVIDWHDLVSMKLADVTIQYVGDNIPKMIEAKSFRVTPAFLYQDYPQEYEGVVYPRQDIKFLDTRKRAPVQKDIHLVMLDWEDLLRLMKEEETNL